jgi:hypothetical protein
VKSRWTSQQYQTFSFPFHQRCRFSYLTGVYRLMRLFLRQRHFFETNSKSSRGLGWLLLLWSLASIEIFSFSGNSQIALSFGTCRLCCWKSKSLVHA